MARGTRLTQDDLLKLYGNAGVHWAVQNSTNGYVVDDYFNSPYGRDGVIIGRNQPYNRKLHKGIKGDPATAALHWNLSAKRGHAMCFATTGSGKNTNLITPALLGYSGSILCLDPKGENAWVTAERRRRMGWKVVILDPFDQVNRRYGSMVGVRETVGRFNPLAHISPRSDEFAAEIATVVEGITTVPAHGDPHWVESGREMLAGLIAAVVERTPGVGSLASVRELLTLSTEELGMLITLIVDRAPQSMAARKLRRFSSASREVSSIQSSMLTQTAILDTTRLLTSMETDRNALDLRELATGRVALYVVLPPDKLETYGRWMRMIVQLAINAIGSVNAPPQPPVLFILDELGTINPGAGLPAIARAVGLMGGLGIRIWGFFQDLSQIQTDYPRNWQTMIANSEIVQVMRANDDDTASYFSRHIGKYTIVQNGKSAFGVNAMNEHALMSLPDGFVLTMRNGGDNFLLPTIPFFEDPGWHGKFRPNPHYAPSTVQLPPAPPKLGFDTSLGGIVAGLAKKDKEMTDAAVKWAKTDGLKAAKNAAGMAARAWKAATEKPEPPIADEKGVKRGANPAEDDNDTIAARKAWAARLRELGDDPSEKT